jgi:hypothetical protein
LVYDTRRGLMITEQERLARLEAQKDDLERRISGLESNQKWGVLTVLGLVLKTIMDLVGVKL